MGDRSRYSMKIEKWQEHLDALDIPRDYLEDESPAFPKRDLLQMYLDMGGSALAVA